MVTLVPGLPPVVAAAPVRVEVLGGVAVEVFSVSASGVPTPLHPVPEPAAPGVVALHALPPPEQPAEAISVRLPIGTDERLYGLGERFSGLDLAGQIVDVWTEDRAIDPGRRTSYVTTPFLLSSRGYGLLVDTSAHSVFDVGATHPGEVRIQVAADELRVLFLAGPEPADVLERHARLVGLPPLPPPWAFGVWKNLIGGSDRVLAEVDRLTRAGIPLDAVWIYDAVDEPSGFGWPWPIYRPVEPGPYPDLPDLIDGLHRRGLKVLGYLNPFLHRGSAAYEEARRSGFLVAGGDGEPVIQPWHDRAYVDFTNPEATAWWQSRIRHALAGVGFDGAMQDFGEDAPADGVYHSGEEGSTVHNRYPVLYARAVREAAQAVKPDDTVFFARGGYSGSQRYTTGAFTGDQDRSWNRLTGLPSVVSAMLSGGLSGWPYWGPDIAGFMARAVPAEKELWVRWVQLGALSPTMRDMLGDAHEPVDLDTDPQTLAVFRAYARLHDALEPYLYGSATLAHRRGLPILRPLFVDHPDDPETYDLDDQYLLGHEVLVAPVLEPGATRRRLYIPEGAWQEYWTGTSRPGPGWIEVDAPLHQIPILVRAGAPLRLPDPDRLWDEPSPAGGE